MVSLTLVVIDDGLRCRWPATPGVSESGNQDAPADAAAWCGGLTRTPPLERTDRMRHHQIELGLSGESTGESYGTFRDMVMRKVTQLCRSRGGRRERSVAKYMRRVRLTKDCIDLPPVSDIDLTVDLTDEQRKASQQLLDESCTEVKVPHHAVNAAVLPTTYSGGMALYTEKTEYLRESRDTTLWPRSSDS